MSEARVWASILSGLYCLYEKSYIPLWCKECQRLLVPKRNVISRRRIFRESTSINRTFAFTVPQQYSWRANGYHIWTQQSLGFYLNLISLQENVFFWKVVIFPFRFFPRWKWYFRSNHDWKFSFLIPDGISGKKSTILRILREYSQILQLVLRILKCTLVP